ncbi:hypothetical protein MN04_00183 [Escherichia phage MN04]|uniref:DUF7367 domain-containing protein n=1 Tax=Escherichia phage MN04 TaxID=2711184 RepID=A0A858HXV1_9CAUD|nr:hypothetical protein MN04_00183 [Escherichia phage MN04]
MIMQDNSIVNTGNLALSFMETAIRNCKDEGVVITSGKGLEYLKAVKSIALKIKDNQALSPVVQEKVLEILYRHREHKSTMGSMRRILAELGSTREYVQHEVVKNDKL